MKRVNLNNLLLFCGSATTFAVGLLVAFVPGLAFVSVYSSLWMYPISPYVQYQSLGFGTHIYTVRFLLSAIGGLIGLIAIVGKDKRSYLGVIAIATAIMGLTFPANNDMRTTFPETRLFDAPWIGPFAMVVGICLMFVGLIIKKEHVPKASFLALPLLLAFYSIPPILILFNYLPWIIFGALTFNPINSLIWLIPFATIPLMAWGALSSRRQETREY